MLSHTRWTAGMGAVAYRAAGACRGIAHVVLGDQQRAEQRSLLAEVADDDLGSRLEAQVALDGLEERRREPLPARADAAAEDDDVGIVDRGDVDDREPDPAADLGPCVRVGQVLGGDAVAARRSHARSPAPRDSRSPPQWHGGPPTHPGQSTMWPPSVSCLPTTMRPSWTTPSPMPVETVQYATVPLPGAGAEAGLGERRAVGVVLDDHRAVEALPEQMGELEPVPGRGHPGRVEQRAALAVERTRRGDGDRLGKLPVHHGLDQAAQRGRAGSDARSGSRRTVPIAASRPALAAILVPPMSSSAITRR